jgi:hypothetical protein
MSPLPFAVAAITLAPFVPVRVFLTAGTVLALWLAASLVAHFLIFRPLFRRNERL